MSHQEAFDRILSALAPYRISLKDIVLTKTILGRGGFGVVILGEMGGSFWRRKSGTLVAVKQLHATGTLDENKKLALALIQELRVWAGLAHPNVIPLVGFYLDHRAEKAWLVSPYFKNGNIRSYLNQHRPDIIIRLRMWGEIAMGIAYLHRRNLCHGDVKSANILIDDTGAARLCDVGLTKLMESGTTLGSSTTGIKGTMRYMAPEFFHDERPTCTKASDVWAWSCLGLEILFEQIPYGHVNVDLAIMARITRGDPPLDLDSVEVHGNIKQLFKRCWVIEPQERVDIKACANEVSDVLDRMNRVKPDIPREQPSNLPAVDQTHENVETPHPDIGNPQRVSRPLPDPPFGTSGHFPGLYAYGDPYTAPHTNPLGAQPPQTSSRLSLTPTGGLGGFSQSFYPDRAFYDPTSSGNPDFRVDSGSMDYADPYAAVRAEIARAQPAQASPLPPLSSLAGIYGTRGGMDTYGAFSDSASPDYVNPYTAGRQSMDTYGAFSAPAPSDDFGSPAGMDRTPAPHTDPYAAVPVNRADDLAKERDYFKQQMLSLQQQLTETQQEALRAQQSVAEGKQSLEHRLDEERKAKERARAQLDSRMEEMGKRKSKFASL